MVTKAGLTVYSFIFTSLFIRTNGKRKHGDTPTSENKKAKKESSDSSDSRYNRQSRRPNYIPKDTYKKMGDGFFAHLATGHVSI